MVIGRNSVSVLVFLGALFLCFGISSSKAFGDNLPVSVDLNLSAGYAHTSVNSGDIVPFMAQFSGGIALKYGLMSGVAVGLASEYQSFNQYSDVYASVGNRTGWRWSIIEPMLEIRASLISLKASYSFLGSYHIPNSTYGGTDQLQYQSPKGGRLLALTQLEAGSSFWIGAFFNRVEYREANFAATPLPLETWSAGAVIEYRLFDKPGMGL